MSRASGNSTMNVHPSPVHILHGNAGISSWHFCWSCLSVVASTEHSNWFYGLLENSHSPASSDGEIEMLAKVSRERPILWYYERFVILALGSIRIHLRRIPSILHQWIADFNAYKTTNTDESTLHRQKLYTRIYLILYVGALSILLLNTSFVERSFTEVCHQPSLVAYEQLNGRYPNTVNCPCTHSSIAYDQFIVNLEMPSIKLAQRMSLSESSLQVMWNAVHRRLDIFMIECTVEPF